MRSKLFASILFLVTTAATGAQAQNIYIDRRSPYDYDRYERHRAAATYGFTYRGYNFYRPYTAGPRLYGYTHRYGERDGVRVVIRERPYYHNGCGRYRYWDGEECVDKRYR